MLEQSSADITCPTPNHLIIPAILDVLSEHKSIQITLFNACGTHRQNTDAEPHQILGDSFIDHYRIVQNDALDPNTQTYLGETNSKNEIWVNRELIECDVKILIGFIEPHFFAGFSGGGKAIMPGMASLQTILRNHNAENIGYPKSTWGITYGNPIYEEILEATSMVENTFLVNVTLNREKEITGIFTGQLERAHLAGCSFVKETSMIPVRNTFDIVITTNSGYPADLNLYQSVKGMSAASQVVCDGGLIIIATECWDGIPEHGLYGNLLMKATKPQEILDRIYSQEYVLQDQWQAQIQASIQQKAQICVYSGNLTDEQIYSALLTPCHDIETTVIKKIKQLDHNAKICILPEGPQAIPYIT